MDLLNVLDCALLTHYVELDALPALPIWGRLSDGLRTTLAGALAAGEPFSAVRRPMWAHQPRPLKKPDNAGAQEMARNAHTRAFATLRLGLLYLRHREGRLETHELLTRGFQVADSYVCGIDPQPFLRLYRELKSSGLDAGRVAALFAPYIAPAEQCVQQWGLRADAASDEQRPPNPAPPLAPPADS